MSVCRYMLPLIIATQASAIPTHVLLQQLKELQEQLPFDNTQTLRQELHELAQLLQPQNSSQQSALVQLILSSPLEMTDTEMILNKTIIAAFTPIIARYPSAQLLGEGREQQPIADQLEHTHLVASFLERIQTKLPQLSPEARELMKTKKFTAHPFGKELQKTLFGLQHLLKHQLDACKGIKSPSNVEKELKKVTMLCSKNVTTILADAFGMPTLE